MTRIFPYQFHKSYLSMNPRELQELHTQLSSLTEDSLQSRILLTSINSLRFKVNSPKFSFQDLISLAIQDLSKRLPSSTPSILNPNPQPSTLNPQSQAPVPEASASASLTPSPSRNSEIPKSRNSDIPNLRPSESFPHPLITGPLLHEATHVQELYYLPLAQLHNTLFTLTQQAISKAITLGWQGEDTSLPNKPWSVCFSPNTERANLQQRIVKLDNQLQNFWNRYHLAIDQINGVQISEATQEALAKETRACSSPSLAVSKQKPLGSYTKKEIDSNLLPSDISLEEVISARQDRNKKLLRRQDRQKTEAHRTTVTEAATELHEWGILIEPAQAKTCDYYGFQVPQDWLRPVLTDEQRKAAHNESQKRSYSRKTQSKRDLKSALQQETQALLLQMQRDQV